LTGAGAEVRAVRLRTDSPLVVTASHNGQANFIVDLVSRGGGGEQNLYNEIGSYSGQVAVADAFAGRYRVKVEADGAWSLRFDQPVPSDQAKTLPGKISGQGAKVVPARSEEDFDPVIRAKHRGQANFIVDLIGYGELTGSQNLYNEIGNFKGETLVPGGLAAGSYLLQVMADGAWTIRFSK
jgi:hypothetical protein